MRLRHSEHCDIEERHSDHCAIVAQKLHGLLTVLREENSRVGLRMAATPKIRGSAEQTRWPIECAGFLALILVDAFFLPVASSFYQGFA